MAQPTQELKDLLIKEHIQPIGTGASDQISLGNIKAIFFDPYETS